MPYRGSAGNEQDLRRVHPVVIPPAVDGVQPSVTTQIMDYGGSDDLLAAARHTDAEVHRIAPSPTTNLRLHRVEAHDRVDVAQGPRLPLADLVLHGVGHLRDQLWRDVEAVKLPHVP